MEPLAILFAHNCRVGSGVFKDVRAGASFTSRGEGSTIGIGSPDDVSLGDWRCVNSRWRRGVRTLTFHPSHQVVGRTMSKELLEASAKVSVYLEALAAFAVK